MPAPILAKANVHIKAKYVNEPVDIYITGYIADPTQPAIEAVSRGDWPETMFKASVCVEHYPLKPPYDEIYLKGWGENEGIPEALVNAGLVLGVTGGVVLVYETHEVPIRRYKLGEDLLKAWHQFRERLAEEDAHV